jgi:hypothetical protein
MFVQSLIVGFFTILAVCIIGGVATFIKREMQMSASLDNLTSLIKQAVTKIDTLESTVATQTDTLATQTATISSLQAQVATLTAQAGTPDSALDALSAELAPAVADTPAPVAPVTPPTT